MGSINNRDKPGPNLWDNWELSACLFLDACVRWSGDRQVSGVTAIAVLEIFLFMAPGEGAVPFLPSDVSGKSGLVFLIQL